jgi:hypothetical protein
MNAFFGSGWLGPYSDLLRAGRSGHRISAGEVFPAPVQTSSGAHPASNNMDTGSFPGVKGSRRGVEQPPPSSARLKKD